MELKTNWEKVGILQGEQKILRKFIQAHFGQRSEGLVDQISYVTDLDILEHLTDQLFQNSDYEVAKRLIDEAYEKQRSLE